jgi:hypothetical protein
MIRAVTIRPRSPALAVAALFACASESATIGDAASSASNASTGGSGNTLAPGESSGSTQASGEATGSSTDASSGSTEGTTGPEPAGLRYADVRQKSAHNSYQRDEAPFDQLVYHRIRSVELDVHVGKTFEPTEDGVWYVYHTDVIDDDTWCVRLGHCLDAFGAFADAAADHEVLTLWIDFKDDWDAGHGPDELDDALQAAFGDALISGPELLALAGCPEASSVQAGLLDPACGWPTLEALRGRVLVVLTGAASVLRVYHDAAGRRALVAPAGSALDDAASWPGTAIFNFAAADVAAAQTYVDAGFVARVWDCNDVARWDAAVAAGAHHVATDKVNDAIDPWARTHDDRGWPFACRSACDAPAIVDEVAILGVEVDSGDVWDAADSAWFLHEDRTSTPDGLWQAFVSTANSHVEPFAKGCLMARASLDPSAPYFAVCRPADDEPLRVQWRVDPGGTSSAIEAAITPDNTLDAPGVVFVRLHVESAGTCVRGEGSADGVTWVEIGARCFAEPLPLQGLSASAHGAGPVRLLFGGVALDADGRGDNLEPRRLDDFAASTAIGTAAATLFDGVLP